MTLLKSNNLFQQTAWPSTYHIVIAMIREKSVVGQMCWANETAVEDYEPVMIELYRLQLQQPARQKSKMISNDQELIQSDPTSRPQNQKGNNTIHKLTAVYERTRSKPNEQLFPK